MGSIIKITDNLRVGVAYQSPTWYSLKEESRQVLYAILGIASRTYDYDVELINDGNQLQGGDVHRQDGTEQQMH